MARSPERFGEVLSFLAKGAIGGMGLGMGASWPIDIVWPGIAIDQLIRITPWVGAILGLSFAIYLQIALHRR